MSASEAVFGQRLATLRKANGFSQTYVAKLMKEAGHSAFYQPTIQRIESGERPIRLSEAYALARVLGVSLSALASEAELGTEHAELAVLRAESARLRAHIDQMGALFDEVRRTAAGVRS